MPDQLLTIFRLCFLVLLYLFFFRVLRAIWTEITAVPAGIDDGAGAKKLSRAERKALRKGGTPAPNLATDPPVATVTPAPHAGATRAGATAPTPAPTATPARPRAVNVIDPPHLAGVGYPLADGMTFGRGGDSSVVFDDSFMSTRHLRITRRDGVWVAEDLGSTNGTYVNRVRVQAPVELTVGDQIQLGNVILEVVG